MSQQRRFIQCDVFTSTPTRGNALAVVVDGDGLTDEQMQTFSAWTNLAETTFLLTPTDPAADYRVRIFTPEHEMLFAGHPTLGSCTSWLRVGGQPKQAGVVRQECGVGLVDIDISGERAAFVAPATTIAPLPESDVQRIARMLSIPTNAILQTASLNNGPAWQVLELASAADVLAADSSGINGSKEQPVGLLGAYGEGSEFDYEVRMFAPSGGLTEDPITGSLNSAIAVWLHEQQRLTAPLLVSQGRCIGRYGRVHVSPSVRQSDREASPMMDKTETRILIGGDTHILIEGTVQL